MPSYVPPQINQPFRLYVSVVSQANRPAFQVNPTIAAGDFQVSTDGGALANLTTLPVVTPAGSSIIQIDLSAAEMNGDNIAISAKDAAGDEWDDLFILLQTSANGIDDLSQFDSTTDQVIVATNNDKTGYGLTSGERTSIADAILGRNLASVAGAASRSLLEAIRILRNRRATVGSTLTVYQEDDSTPAWTATVTGDPVSEIDPT